MRIRILFLLVLVVCVGPAYAQDPGECEPLITIPTDSPALVANAALEACNGTVIELQPGATYTVTRGSPDGILSALPVVNTTYTIDGQGATVQIDADVRFAYIEETGNLTLKNLTIIGGSPVNGENSTFGGGILVEFGELTMINTVMQENVATFGGALFNDGGTITAINSQLDRNIAGISGGTLYNIEGPVSLVESLIAENQAAFGGAIYNDFDGVLRVKSSIFATNSTFFLETGISGFGGALINFGDALIRDSLFSVNQSVGTAGAIQNEGGGRLTVTNSTFAGNISSAFGNSINNFDADTTIFFSTFRNNIGSGEGTLTLRHTDSDNSGDQLAVYASYLGENVVLNTSSSFANCRGNITSLGFNFSDDASCNFGEGRDEVSAEFAELANNGGFAPSFMPLEESPLINVVPKTQCGHDDDNDPSTDPVRLLTDQNGLARPTGGNCDVGASEFNGTPKGQPDVNSDTLITPSDVVFVVNRLGTTDALADVNGDGFVTELDVALVQQRLGESK